eukprot:Clim_evm22s11 gene=Clim_evmTU22s11
MPPKKQQVAQLKIDPDAEKRGETVMMSTLGQCSFEMPLNLNKVLKCFKKEGLKEAELWPSTSRYVSYVSKSPKGNIRVLSDGKVLINGAVSEKCVKQLADLVAKVVTDDCKDGRFKKLQGSLKLSTPTVNNFCGVRQFNGLFNVQTLAKAPEVANFEPKLGEKEPVGLTIALDNGIKCRIFSSGKVVINGGKGPDDIFEAGNKKLAFLEKYVQPVPSNSK